MITVWKPKPEKPTVFVGLETLRRLAEGERIILEEVNIIRADDFPYELINGYIAALERRLEVLLHPIRKKEK